MDGFPFWAPHKTAKTNNIPYTKRVPKELITSEQTIFFKNLLGPPHNGVIYTPVTCV